MSDLTLFNYGDLEPEQANETRAAAERIRLLQHRTVEDIISIGAELAQQKKVLPHGSFEGWIKAEFGMALRTARRLMDVGRVYHGKSANLADLGPSVLYELAAPSTPQAVRDAVEDKAKSGERVDLAEVKRLKAANKIDHANGDPKDNRWSNLREATKFQNHMNTIKPSANKSGYKGVKRLENGRFSSCITLYRKRIYLGTFDTIKEAHAAYCGAAKAVFGEFANGGEPK